MDQQPQLLQSMTVSEEMLLQHSLSSKFLPSPTLSLGLLESKITKRSLQNGGVVGKGELMSVKNSQVNRVNQRLEEDSILLINPAPQSRLNQYIHIPSKLTNPTNVKQPTSQLLHKQPTNNKPIINDNGTLISYQMQVEYLRKLNLMQQMQIQKLRKLIRISKHSNVSQINQAITDSSSRQYQARQFKTSKKAIDIIRSRSTNEKQHRQQQTLIIAKTTKKQPEVYNKHSVSDKGNLDNLSVVKIDLKNSKSKNDSIYYHHHPALRRKTHQQQSLMQFDVNTSLTKHNVSSNSQSTCKKVKSRRNTLQKIDISSSIKHNKSITQTNITEGKDKENVNPGMLAMRRKDHHKGKGKKSITSGDLYCSIKKHR